MSDDEPQNPEADWHFTHAEMMAHDAALLEAQSTELARRWLEAGVIDCEKVLEIMATTRAARALPKTAKP